MRVGVSTKHAIDLEIDDGVCKQESRTFGPRSFLQLIDFLMLCWLATTSSRQTPREVFLAAYDVCDAFIHLTRSVTQLCGLWLLKMWRAVAAQVNCKLAVGFLFFSVFVEKVRTANLERKAQKLL